MDAESQMQQIGGNAQSQIMLGGRSAEFVRSGSHQMVIMKNDLMTSGDATLTTQVTATHCSLCLPTSDSVGPSLSSACNCYLLLSIGAGRVLYRLYELPSCRRQLDPFPVPRAIAARPITIVSSFP